MKRLPVVNCLLAPVAPCRPIVCAGNYHGGRPSPLTCERCVRRVEREPGPAVAWVDVPAEEPRVARSSRALPIDRWPTWAKWVATWRTEGEVGVGSTIERELGIGGRLFKATFAAFGVDCGCADRRKRFDELYPY